VPTTLPRNPEFSPEYEQKLEHSWLRQMRLRLSQMHYGGFLREKDMDN